MASHTQSKSGDYASRLGNATTGLADKAAEQIERVAQNVESAATAAAERGRQASEQVQEVAGNFRTAVDKSVKDQPITTLLLAAGLGFVIGALWKS